MAEAGWYPDPQDSNALQYFDGQRWTGDRRPATPPVQAPQPPAQAQAPQPPATAQQPSAPGDQAAAPPPYQGPQYSQPSSPAAPSPPAAPYQQPGQAGQAPYQPGQAGQAPYQQPGQPPWGAPPEGAAPRRSRKKLLIGAGVVVVLVAGGLGGWKLASGDDKPKSSYQGKQIAEPDKVLQAGESAVTASVTKRHGAKGNDTRCYFTQPNKTPSGQKKTDVDDGLLCGPVLFVDGDDSKPYIRVPFKSEEADGKAELTPASSLDDAESVAAPQDSKLVRPDGKSAPDGAGGLKVPLPPPADKDVLVSAPLGQTTPPARLTGAMMLGQTESVSVLSAGTVSRYGSGDTARSAPDSQQLLAFRIRIGGGDLEDSASANALTITVTGSPARKVPVPSNSDDYVFVAVPKSGTAVLTLNDTGYQQTLSLPDGKAGANNVLVMAREHRVARPAKVSNVPIRLSKGSATANANFRTTFSKVNLDFWVPRHPDKHPSSPKNAFLSVDLTYSDPEDPGTFGWDPKLLHLRLANGTVVQARNIAAAGKVFNVFEVPANFTTGTLQISGTIKVGTVTVKVAQTTQFPISIPAG